MPIDIAGIKWLPLFYPFQYDPPRMGYRIVSDSEIEILSMDKSKYTPDFPFSDYPDFFAKTPVTLLPIQYEQQRALCMYDYLTRRDIQFPNEGPTEDGSQLVGCGLAGRSDEEILGEIGLKFTRLGTDSGLLLGKARFPCPNAKCERSGWAYGMYEFATVWNEPIEGVDLWQTGEEVVIFFLVCEKCGAILTTNELV